MERFQGSEDDVQYSNLGLNQLVSRELSGRFLRRVALMLNLKRSFSDAPGAERMEFDQLKADLKLSSTPISHPSFFFPESALSATLGLRKKTDFLDASQSALAAIGNVDLDSDAFSLTLGQVFSRRSKVVPAENLSWSLRYESQKTDLAPTRDYSYVLLALNYSRTLSKALYGRSLTLGAGLDYRSKSWDQPITGDVENEAQVGISTYAQVRWFSGMSSRLYLNYMDRAQDLRGGGSKSVNQWIVGLSNTFLTF
ncbi:MAG: hypothetical protein HQL31_13205 [Planctomycetes bacterium]|nr:hypothetical protein [Planctomycetota bacterium]